MPPEDEAPGGPGEGLGVVLERVLTKARRFTRAEAGTIYVRQGNTLHFAVVQNDALARRAGQQDLRRIQMEPLELTQHSLAGYVGITGRALNVRDAYRITPERPYRFDRAFDERNNYRTVSVFLVPIHDQSKSVLGVIQLINALDAHGRPVPFRPPYGYVQHALASYAAIAIRNAGNPAGAAPASTPTPAAGAWFQSLADMPSVIPDTHTMSPIGRRLGELLAAKGLVSHERLARALAEQNRTKEKLGAILVRMGLINEDQLVEFLAHQYNLETIAVPEAIDPELALLVPAEVCRKYELIPIERNGRSLTVAMGDPTNLAAIDDVGFLTGLRIVPAIAPPSRVRRAIEQAYQIPSARLDDVFTDAESDLLEIEIIEAGESDPSLDLVELRSSSDQAPVVRIVNMLLLDAIRRGASDIHIEPFQSTFRVRFRIDGVLQQVMAPPKRLASAITSRLKIMADLDISERRRPQDGHIRLRSAEHQVDVRVATLPTVFGEGVILRVLDRNATTLDPARLGFDAQALERLQSALRAQHGLILVTGPTGSGKTTTLYAALQSLNSLEVKIVTIEDPVEYHLEGVNQVQVSEEIGRTFPAALRSFLRSDPDVIMVGEMRDLETAQTAVRSALTGHLVLSTLHTNDGPSTVARLLDMEIPPFLAAACLRLIVAQRLVRKICVECREAYEMAEEQFVRHGHGPAGRGPCTLFRGTGCPACNFTGMRGRVALYEMMPLTAPMRELIARAPTIGEIRHLAHEEGMVTLREAGLRAVLEGVTTLEEVLRVTSD
ncbi:MAG: Flp pilus assembly complex ATPase component TadA [Candidatus Rokubacteria bacterium]|nr:Flp pilus assembly complex ATPase component TadA [Candidatus Rokubacteria bacterium]